MIELCGGMVVRIWTEKELEDRSGIWTKGAYGYHGTGPIEGGYVYLNREWLGREGKLVYDPVMGDFSMTLEDLGHTFSVVIDMVAEVLHDPRKSCECGAHVVGSHMHSDFCPLYRKDQFYRMSS